MGQKMTDKQVKSQQTPGFAPETQDIVTQLSNLFTSQGTQTSPFYSDLRRMYANTLGTQSFALPDYVTKTLESAATTGLPSNTPLQQTPFYQAVAPTFQTALKDILAGTKENFGAQGALRTGAYEEAAGRGVTKGLGDLILNAAQQAFALEEAAKGRQLAGTEQAIASMAAPYTAAQAAAQGAGAIQGSQYPLLASMLGLAQIGAGTKGVGYVYPGEYQSGSVSCCWTFIEGEGEITESVRRYRDSHFGKWSDVGLGYRWLSSKLVPLMRRSKLFKRLVRFILTKPLTSYAKWECNDNNYGFLFKPLAFFWIRVWSFIGKRVTYRDSKILATA